jgi:hypothetical protein
MKFKITLRLAASLLLFTTLELQPTTVDAQLAFSTYTYNVGVQPTYVIAAELNGDGKPDLISANYGDNTLTVLTNNGSGIFGFNATQHVGNHPRSVAAADVNGDGKLDLISANLGDDTLTVLTNNGIGVFGSNATLNVGGGPHCVLAADVNGDGKVDLISANNVDSVGSVTNTLTVLTNDGSGTFGFNATLHAGSQPVSVVATDTKGVGRLDLICANFTGNTLTVLTNNGSGVFGSDATLSVGSYPSCVVGADVNGDGKPDLLSANWQAGTLTVLTNNGNASGAFGSNATLKVASGPWAVLAADVNGDSKLDLISTAGNTLTVLTNNGSGVFSSNATLNVESGPQSIVAADVSGDSKLDLISANNVANTLTVLINQTPYATTPILNITSAGNQVAVIWPAWVGNRILECTTNLSAPNWVTVTNGAPVLGVTLTNTSPGLFFRLR